MRRLALALILATACGGGTLDGADAGPRCGNGVREGTEECDTGAQNGPNAGCERDCTFSCIPNDSTRGDSHCDPHDPCKGTGTCGTDRTCHLSGGLANGADCGGGKICRDGACQAPVCGDGIVTGSEECDDGVNDGSQGCDSTCHFVCVSTDSTRDCTPSDPCAGPSACNDDTHICSTRTPLANGTACATGKVCRQGQCLPDLCGNGTVDTGEQCDPPNGTTCDNNCQNIVCGDGILAGNEQCDDGNLNNLDGCDSHCRFEQDVRATTVTMLYGTDTYCTANALGSAIGSNAQGPFQTNINNDVKAGVMTMAFQVLGLTDLTGTNGSGLSLGALTGSPYATPPLSHNTYDGTRDLDWWYYTDGNGLDGSRVPKALLPASITSKTLNAGPGHMSITLAIGSGTSTLTGSNVKIRASVGGASAPTETTAATPGHTPSEHVDRSLLTFASLTNGELCGNISAYSMYTAAMPLSLQTGGANACDEGYTSANHLIDAIVNGCTMYYGLVTIFAPTQPDKVDSSVPVAGAGAPYQLVPSAGKVSSCKDKNGSTVDLTTCLKAAAYSSAMQFAADRVILK